MKTHKMIVMLMAVAALVLTSVVSQAALVATDSGPVYVAPPCTDAAAATAWGANPVNTGTDLLLNHLTSMTYVGSMLYGSTAANINDGLMVTSVAPVGGPYTAANTENLAVFGDGGVLSFVLDNKYDITRIDSFTMFFPARIGQKYTVDVSTNGGAAWSSLTSVNYNNNNTEPSSDIFLRGIALTDNLSAPIATGVNAVRFTFSDPYYDEANPAVTAVYSEIAMYGAAIPEPGTLVLLGLGGLFCLARGKRGG